MQSTGKAIRIVRFNVWQRIKFVKKSKVDIFVVRMLGHRFNVVKQRWIAFKLLREDNSLVLRESWWISRYPSQNRGCGVEKFSTPSVERRAPLDWALELLPSLPSFYCQVLLKKAAKDRYCCVSSTATSTPVGEGEIRFLLW